MADFIEIENEFLASIATNGERIPDLYYSDNAPTRRVFWQRLHWLHRLALRHANTDGTCLDFGAGGGIFLPTLAKTFRKVVSLDLVTDEAQQIAERYSLENVRLVQGNALEIELDEAPFAAIVAADVLEHFRELGPPVAALRRFLADDGVLLTSLPTENFVYVLLRVFFGFEKPEDHYHTAYEVERFLEQNGFRRIVRWYVPLRLPIAPLFTVSAWRKV